MAASTSMLGIMPFEHCFHHDFFDCGVYSINDCLKQHSNQHDSMGNSKVFTAVNEFQTILGFYCINTTSIEFENIPKQLCEKIDSYPISSVSIELLAVDKSAQGNGLGAKLLIDALQRIYQVGEQVGMMFVLVEAPNEKARAFYLHFGFLPLSGQETKLFLPMDRITRLFSKTTH